MKDKDIQPPTLKTIADITGLSLSTVSLSLRDGSKLRPSTRDKVAKAAKQIGYVPNRAGVRLRTGRTNVLALVLAADVRNIDFTRILIQGIGAYINGGPYHLNVVPEFERTDPLSTVDYILKNRSADGVILTHTSAQDTRVQRLLDANFPFVSHGRTAFATAHAYHDFHAERFIELSLQRLVSKERKHAILAIEDNGTTNFSNTVGSFKRLLGTMPISGTVIENDTQLDDPGRARAYGQELASNNTPFDALICNNELTAVAIIEGLREGDLHLHKDYSLVCKQTTDMLPVLYPTMDTVAEDLFATGHELAKLLLSAIEGDATKDLQSLHEPIVHWRSQ